MRGWPRTVFEGEQGCPQRCPCSHDARLEKVIGESLILKEIVLLFVRVWLEHNPPIDEHLEEDAAASAEARFERFLDFVAQALTPGKSLGAVFSLESAEAVSVADHNGEARA